MLVTNMLLEAGADPNSGDSLIYAVKYNHSHVTSLLLKHDADVNNEDFLAVKMAAKYGNARLLFMLLK